MRQTVDKLEKLIWRGKCGQRCAAGKLVGRGKVLTMVGFKTLKKKAHTHILVAWLVSWEVLVVAVGWGPQI